jgi:peptidoglycan/LPS O-acetylase OafA/YrhL
MNASAALTANEDEIANDVPLQAHRSASHGRIKVLDGWRGLAILTVCSSHICERTRYHTSLLSNLGLLGVDIFFVLSGYVITRSLLAERERTGSFSLREFYRRRVFRILPVAMTFLVVLAVLNQFMHLGNLTARSLVASALFFRNYLLSLYPAEGFYTNHFWSLSIEEQFYLLWPASLLLLGNRRAVWFAAATGAGCAAWRLYSYTHYADATGSNLKFWMMRTEYRLDGLLIGCLLALLLTRPSVRGFIYRNFPKETPLLCAFPLLLNYQHSRGNPTLITYLLISLAIASTLLVEEGLAFICLKHRGLVWLGTISFSLYVWQELFLESPFTHSPLGWLGVFPFNAIAALSVAAASYYLIERPLIAFGRRAVHRSGYAANP